MLGGAALVAAALPCTTAAAARTSRTTAAHSRTTAAHPRLTARARPGAVLEGHHAVVSGRLTVAGAPQRGELLELQSDALEPGRFANVAHTLTGRGGRYAFAALPVFEDTRFRVIDPDRRGLASTVVVVEALPPVYPRAAQVAAAAGWLAGRAGRTAFALVDDRGRLGGVDVHGRFHSASVVKSMMLVAYLRMLAARHRGLGPGDRALLYPMIHSSDNDAASRVLAAIGQPALARVARDAHMADYLPAVGWWAFTEVSAADLARFFVVQDSLIPARFVGYARSLESTIEPSQSWGIPPAVRPAFSVFFKGGWLPESEGLVNQAARLEHGRIVLGLAVLTAGDPSMAYGEATIEGVASRLFGVPPPRGHRVG